MIVDFFLLMWILGVTVPVYWALPRDWTRVRLGIIIGISTILVASLNPLILIGIGFYAAVFSAFVIAFERGVSLQRLRPLCWTIFIPLGFLEFIPPAWLVAGFMGERAAQIPLLVGLTYMGLSYTAIRCFIMVREHFEKKGPTALQAVSAFLFFGHLAAGPISGTQPWRQIAKQLDTEDLAIALSRIMWGAALFFVVQEIVRDFDTASFLGLSESHRAVAWAEIYRSFLALYIDFTGYSEIAIGTALLFGVRLPENFRWPLLATSIQKFWTRWHLSLGRFINIYLFNAVVREVGKPGLAIFLSFVAVGLWHQLSVPYLLWGLGHGAALWANMFLRKRYLHRSMPKLATFSLTLLGWAFTMTYVALLSTIANAENMEAVWGLIGDLFS